MNIALFDTNIVIDALNGIEQAQADVDKCGTAEGRNQVENGVI